MNVSERSSKKEKNQNIQVFVRLRPINNREKELKSMGVVEVNGSKDVIVKMTPLESKLTKKFSFDRAFGPNSKQVEVYHEVVSPLIEEVLAGYNCTVFAYGQTGTGKTHTMVGESSSSGDIPWQNDPMSGIIPRALSQLFDELRITNTEFTVRVSYLELYNEELFDLLSSSEDNSKLRIYEDVTRKGSNIVNGLEEVTVYNKNEVYKIMGKGQEKRKIASTLMNAQSSRSHTVFTIVVHMKENSPDGEELMKIGKLNLVDLAGSENISKAGSDNPSRKERARECVNINQSLLTLGRVITALVERHPHIPYRESKLTRLLQESLGGRTKTSIIATISPGHRDVEETLSTLDYAYRARCIQNKPEVNQRITKHAVLKEYSEEIDRLKRDLLASREKNGVYISFDSYNDMNMKLEEQSKEIQDQILYIKAIKEERDKVEALFNEMEGSLRRKEQELEVTSAALDDAKVTIQVTQKDLTVSRMECDEQKELVSKRQATETVLSEQAKKLLKVADDTTADVQCLHNTVDKKKALESTNLEKVKGFGEKSQTHRQVMREQLNAFNQDQTEQLRVLQDALDAQTKKHIQSQNEGKRLINDLMQRITEAMFQSCCVREQCVGEVSKQSEGRMEEARGEADRRRREVLEKLGDVEKVVRQLQVEKDKQLTSAVQMLQFVQQWKDMFSVKMQCMRRAQDEWWHQYTTHMDTLATQCQQYHTQALNDAHRMTIQRTQHQEEMFNGIKQLRQALDDLESKATSASTLLSAEEKKMSSSLEVGGAQLSGTLDEGRRGLEAARGAVDSSVGEVEACQQSYSKDVGEMSVEHVEQIRRGGETQVKLVEMLSGAQSRCGEMWLEYGSCVSEGYKEVAHKAMEAITTQEQAYSESLKECHSSAGDMVPPLDVLMEELGRCAQDNRNSIGGIERTLEEYAHSMGQSLAVTDTIESRFLNEEYKIYSPTGKTPVRREFSYPKELAATSPHERILRRFRNMRDGVQSPQNHSIINLDQTIEEPSIPTVEIVAEENAVITVSTPESNDPSNRVVREKVFLEPIKAAPRATPRTSPNNAIVKSTSDSDIYSLVHAESDSKENLNHTGTEKRETKSRLRQPTQKRNVLANRNC